MKKGLSSDSGGTVLLTGATGFLGGAVAAELLEQRDDIELLFLIRARDGRTALERLLRSISRFDVSAKACARVTEKATLCGDLATFFDAGIRSADAAHSKARCWRDPHLSRLCRLERDLRQPPRAVRGGGAAAPLHRLHFGMRADRAR
jgi:NAD(P)-dependent dehydrogenase (short-subunit alcohol dehydrogenase family)